MFVHTRSSAPKRFAKFGWRTRTFCHKKVGKVRVETKNMFTHIRSSAPNMFAKF